MVLYFVGEVKTNRNRILFLPIREFYKISLNLKTKKIKKIDLTVI